MTFQNFEFHFLKYFWSIVYVQIFECITTEQVWTLSSQIPNYVCRIPVDHFKAKIDVLTLQKFWISPFEKNFKFWNITYVQIFVCITVTSMAIKFTNCSKKSPLLFRFHGSYPTWLFFLSNLMRCQKYLPVLLLEKL